MLRPTFAVALPAFGLAWYLSQMSPAQRSDLGSVVRSFLGSSAAVPAVAPKPAVMGVGVQLPATKVNGNDTFAIDADRLGQYETTMVVGGRDLPVLVDTGASYVLLTADAAAGVGIHPTAGDYKYSATTANGVTRCAAVTLPSIRVGNVEARAIQAFVALPGALTGHSLLGMSFLRKLSGFEIQADRLVLRQ